ncbi:MAG: hypothetical protein IT204_10755 [Fimbriimonadaceae bacterium]|nr:hypothetical protein [Fimbriimonadaceae bacterium]
MIDVFLSWDVEDPIHAESDDALLRLCQLLTAQHVRGNFFVVGEKARLLRERGRADVLAALAAHEVGYHGNWWFEYPESAMVYGERLSWDEAVEQAVRIELPGLHDVAEITGQWPVAWVQHQNNVAAMLPWVLRRLGVPVWNGGFGSGPLTGWLMDQCVVSRGGHSLSLQGDWTAGDGDPLQPQPPARAVDPARELRAFQEQFEAAAERAAVVVPLGHPTCWVTSEWWGWYEWDEPLHHRPAPYTYQRSRQWRRVPLRSAADSAAHFAWTAQAVAWLAQRSDVCLTTFGEYHARHAEPRLIWLDLTQVDQLAGQLVDGPRDTAVGGTTLSAADGLGVLAHLFSQIVRTQQVPQRVAVQRLLGPTEPLAPAAPTVVSRGAWFALAGQLYDTLVEQRRVPGVLRAVQDLSPAAATMVWARAWQHYRQTGGWPTQLEVSPPSALPPAAELDFFRAPRASSTHAPAGYTSGPLAEQVRRQSWSYRPFAAAAG